jgi:hypothetical protein
MTTRSCIRKLFARPLRKRAHRARLAVQALEDRTVPSTFTVTNLLDDGSAGSLRWAVGQANMAGGAIDFDPAVFATPQTITLTGTQLELTDTTGTETITGPAVGVTVNGNNASRVFQIDGGVSASISGLTISGGNAGSGNGGGLDNVGTTTLTDCTFSGNSAWGGGGLANLDGTLTLTNCTVSGNSAGGTNGGGLDCFYGTLRLTNCTVSGNSAYDGGIGGPFSFGGIFNYYASTTLTNTIVAENSGAEIFELPAGTNNLIGGNPLLAPLGNYGGPRQTMALLPGSPALDAGTSGPGIPTTDERGFGRVGAVDIGAFESQGFTLALVPGGTPQSSAIGTPFANPLAVTVTANNPIEPVNGGAVSFVTNRVNGAAAVLAAPSAVIAGGQAATAAAPNNAVGSYTVVASAAPSSPAVSFALTNTGQTFPSLVVNTTSAALFPGPGFLSLPEAIVFANLDSAGISTITFDPTVFATPQTITLTGTQLELSNPSETETITGPAAGVTVSGGGLSRVFQIDGMVTASISGLTITGSNFSGYRGGGGGINNSGTLSLTNCTVSGNSANGFYGRGGGISNTGTLSLAHCTISGNTASGFSGSGGGINNTGILSLTHCTVSGNSAQLGGAGVANGGNMTLTNCSISDNSSSGHGGGIQNQQGTATLTNCTISGNSGPGAGGGLLSAAGTLTLTNCTVSGNRSGFMGGGLSAYGDRTTLTNCTVSGNSATVRGGGIYIGSGASLATLSNTIVAANTSGGNPSDINGNVNSNSSYNLIGTGGSGGLINGVKHNQVGVANPGLGTLGDHGGQPQTIDLLAGSPALNAGDPAQLGLADQRGVVRTGGVNIGAYQASASAFVLTAPDTVTAGMAFDVTVTAVDIFAQVAVGYTGTVSFSTTDPDPNVVLPPDYPFTLADQGRHTFLAGFTLQTPGLWTLTASDNAGGFASSVPITVTSGPGGGGSASPNMPPHRHAFRVVDRFFAALPGDPELLRLRGTARRGEGPSRALLWAARHGDSLIRKDDCFEGWNCGEGAGAFYG